MSVIKVNQITNRDGSGGPIISGLTTVGVVTSALSVGTTNLYVSGDFVTVSVSATDVTASGSITGAQLSVSGLSTFTGSVDANGGLDINGNTTGLNATGVSTFSGNIDLNADLILGDNDEIQLGALSGGDLLITHLSSTNNSLIRNRNASGSFLIDTTPEVAIEIRNSSGGEKMGVFTPDGSVELYHANSKKLETSTDGVTVSGTAAATQLNVSGIATAGTFSGSGASLTSITNSNLSGSAGITNANLANSTISGVSLGSNLGTLTMGVSGNGLSGSDTYNGSAGSTFTVASNATNSNTASTIVFRDGSGNFSAGTITASLSGNATSANSATTATNANNINLADESSDTTCFPVFARAATGNQAPKTDSDRLTYNASSGLLVATTHQATSIIADSTLRVGSASTTSMDLYVVGNSASGVHNLGSKSSSFAIDMSTGNNYNFTIAGNITLNNPTNTQPGQSGVIMITQDGTGSRTLAYQSHWNFVDGTAPTITAGAGTTSVLAYMVQDTDMIIAAPLLALG